MPSTREAGGVAAESVVADAAQDGAPLGSARRLAHCEKRLACSARCHAPPSPREGMLRRFFQKSALHIRGTSVYSSSRRMRRTHLRAFSSGG